jgi:hypothetical protein
VGRKVAVADGKEVGVRVGVAVGVKVGVRVGQRVSVGRAAGEVVGAAGELVKVCVGRAVRIGGLDVSVKVNVPVGNTPCAAVGVELARSADRLPLWLWRS